jgi:hypothetical protein
MKFTNLILALFLAASKRSTSNEYRPGGFSSVARDRQFCRVVRFMPTAMHALSKLWPWATREQIRFSIASLSREWLVGCPGFLGKALDFLLGGDFVHLCGICAFVWLAHLIAFGEQLTLDHMIPVLLSI